jgi:hypothetical protein
MQAIHDGHDDIQDGDIRTVLAGQIEGLAPVLDLDEGVVERGRGSQQATHGRQIVGDDRSGASWSVRPPPLWQARRPRSGRAQTERRNLQVPLTDRRTQVVHGGLNGRWRGIP